LPGKNSGEPEQARLAGKKIQFLDGEPGAKGQAQAVWRNGQRDLVETAMSDQQLDAAKEFFGEKTTVRRFYLRMLAHSHEHMGQLIAYTRLMGYRVPWPDPLKNLDRAVDGPGRTA